MKNLLSNGETALIFASSNGHEKVVSLLLDAGADPEILNR